MEDGFLSFIGNAFRGGVGRCIVDTMLVESGPPMCVGVISGALRWI